MEIRRQTQQSQLDRLPTKLGSPPARATGSDVKEFLIERLDDESGAVTSSISLKGSSIPHQPIDFSQSQEVYSFYYPGGGSRQPTMQRMGGRHDPIQMRGRFESYTGENREQPMQLMRLLSELAQSGDVVRLTLGPFLRYAILSNFIPTYMDNSRIDYALTWEILGETNPFEASQQQAERLVQEIFDPQSLDDVANIREEIKEILSEIKEPLERKQYLPRTSPFTTAEKWLEELQNSEAIGPILEIGQQAKSSVERVLGIANNVLRSVDQFLNSPEQAVSEVQKLILSFDSMRAKIFGIQTRLYNSYSKISGAVNTATRYEAFDILGLIGGPALSIARIIKTQEDKLYQQRENQLKIYVVREGDNWISIATQQTESWENWQEIQRINNLGRDPKEGDFIFVPD